MKTINTMEEIMEQEAAIPEVLDPEPTEKAVVAQPKSTALTSGRPETLTEMIKRRIAEANPEFEGLDDLTRIGEFVTIGGSKNNWVIKDGDQILDDLGDPIEIRAIEGKDVFQRWATQEEKTAGEYEGLVCWSIDKQNTGAHGDSCADCPFGKEHCGPRYLLTFTLANEAQDPEMPFPRILLTNLSKSSSIAFGKMYSRITSGAFRAKGVKPFSPLSKVVLSMAVEAASQDGNNWTFAKFEPLRMAE